MRPGRGRRLDTASRAALIFGVDSYTKQIKNLFGSALIGYWQLKENPAGKDYLTFNGSTTTVNCGSGASLDNLHDNAFTAEAWIKALGPGESGGARLFSKGDSAGHGWALWLANGLPTGRIQCATTDAFSASSLASLVDSTFHHVAMTFDDAGDRKIYIAVDGIWQTYSSQTAGVDAVVVDEFDSLYLGDWGGAGRVFDGSIGWMRISNSQRYAPGVNFAAPARTTIPAVDANTVALWPLNEGYGSVAGDLGPNNNDGTITAGDWGAYPVVKDTGPERNNGSYVGANLAHGLAPAGTGTRAPFFDGVNDYVNLYSANLAADFNGEAGSFLIWCRVSALGIWTDGTLDFVMQFQVDADNDIYIRKQIASNTMLVKYEAGAVEELFTVNGINTTDWFHIGLTWDLAAGASGEAKLFVDGSQSGVTSTGLGTWAGVLQALTTRIAQSSWQGWLAHAMLLDRAATPAEIAEVYALGV